MRSTEPRVTSMKGHFVNIKALSKSLNLVNRAVIAGGDRVPFRDGVRWIRVNQFGQYQYRESFSEEEPWKVVNILPLHVYIPVSL